MKADKMTDALPFQSPGVGDLASFQSWLLCEIQFLFEDLQRLPVYHQAVMAKTSNLMSLNVIASCLLKICVMVFLDFCRTVAEVYSSMVFSA